MLLLCAKHVLRVQDPSSPTPQRNINFMPKSQKQIISNYDRHYKILLELFRSVGAWLLRKPSLRVGVFAPLKCNQNVSAFLKGNEREGDETERRKLAGRRPHATLVDTSTLSVADRKGQRKRQELQHDPKLFCKHR